MHDRLSRSWPANTLSTGRNFLGCGDIVRNLRNFCRYVEAACRPYRGLGHAADSAGEGVRSHAAVTMAAIDQRAGEALSDLLRRAQAICNFPRAEIDQRPDCTGAQHCQATLRRGISGEVQRLHKATL